MAETDRLPGGTRMEGITFDLEEEDKTHSGLLAFGEQLKRE